MREALRAHPEVRQGVEATLRLEALTNGGSAAAIDTEAFFDEVRIEKIDCVSAEGTAGYRCDFRWGRNDDELARTHTGRFFQTDRGWTMAVVR